MKKVLLIFLAYFIAITAIAQREQHLKFMNIPLTGEISNFQWHLKKRGIRLEHKFNDGARAYKGQFSGQDANIFVYFNTKSKIVYRAKACISYPTLEIAKSHYESFVSNLKDKYIKGLVEKEDESSMLMKVLDDLFNPLGFISVHIEKRDLPYNGKEYTIYIDYRDILNSIYDIERNKDDL